MYPVADNPLFSFAIFCGHNRVILDQKTKEGREKLRATRTTYVPPRATEVSLRSLIVVLFPGTNILLSWKLSYRTRMPYTRALDTSATRSRTINNNVARENKTKCAPVRAYVCVCSPCSTHTLHARGRNLKERDL